MKKLIICLLLLSLYACNNKVKNPECVAIGQSKLNHCELFVYRVGNDTLYLAELDVIMIKLNRTNNKTTVSWF